jgi:hypothetical protein
VLLGVWLQTVVSWTTGGVGVPGPVVAYLRLFQVLSEKQRQVELSRCSSSYGSKKAPTTGALEDHSGEWAI